jgi:sRNA-binding protein
MRVKRKCAKAYNFFMAKDPAAVALGKKRWKGKTDEEKAEHARMLAEARARSTTPEQRSEAARTAVEARWAKAKKKAVKKKT